MKFLKTIAIDILMIPVCFEVIFKLNKGVDIKNDENFSKYARWVATLANKLETPTDEVE